MTVCRPLALDLALRTGWAYDSTQPGVPFGAAYQLPGTEGNKAEGIERGKPLLYLRRFLISQIGNLHPTMVVAEAPMNIVRLAFIQKGRVGTSRASIEMQLQMHGICEEVCYELQIPFRIVESGDIKVFAGGRATSDKTATQAFCRGLGWDFDNDHNVADAQALWAYAKSKFDKSFAPAPAQGRPPAIER